MLSLHPLLCASSCYYLCKKIEYKMDAQAEMIRRNEGKLAMLQEMMQDLANTFDPPFPSPPLPSLPPSPPSVPPTPPRFPPPLPPPPLPPASWKVYFFQWMDTSYGYLFVLVLIVTAMCCMAMQRSYKPITL